MALNTLPNAGLTNRGYPSDRLVTPLIINGDMSVAQRATSVTTVGNGNSGYQTVDRWEFSETGSTSGEFTITQSTDVPTGQGFAKSTKFDVTTADTSLGSTHQIYWRQGSEGQNLQMLKKGTSAAEKVTAAFWVKSNKTGTYIVYILDGDNSRFVSKSYTISSSNTWEKKVISFPADTTGALDNDNAKSLTFHFVLGAGSDFSSGTLQQTWAAVSGNNPNRLTGQVNLLDSTSNEWYVTGVQLEVGEFDSTSVPSFPFESFDNNLQKCKRYYESFGTFGDYLIGYGYGSGSDTARTSLPFTVEKRATPTMADVSSSRQVRINWTSSDGTAVNQNSTTQATFSEPNIKNSGYIQIGGYSSIGGGQHGYCRMNNATTTYEADAEL